MEGPMKSLGYNAGWVLVYTSAIMMILRFFAGPIVHKLSPIGLLIVSSILAIAGLFALSKTGSSGLGLIVAAATLYAFGKTFFWPTMLGVTSEQCPKGGSLSLNAISGIGMIAVGVLGAPFIGFIASNLSAADLKENHAKIAESVLKDDEYFSISYKAIDGDLLKEKESFVKAEKKNNDQDQSKQSLEDAENFVAVVKESQKVGRVEALSRIALFPAFMLVCYVLLFLYFKGKGGYKAVELEGGSHA